MSAIAVAGVVGNGRPAIRFDQRFSAACAVVVRSWKWPFFCAALVGAIDLIWAHAAGLTFIGLGHGYRPIAGFLLVGLAWHAGGISLAQRAGASRWAGYLESLGKGAGFFGLWCAVALATVLLTYLCADLALPFQDARFAAFDHRLGFDWPIWSQYVAHHSMLGAALSVTYRSHGTQLLLIFFVAALSGDDRRAAECFWICTLSVIVACVVSGLMPAIGAKVYFGLGTSAWVPDVTRLRAPGPAVFDLVHIEGIVSMPSYHAALALFFMWSSRRTSFVGYGFILWNLVMIVSTLSEGGHYLVDVIAGLALAAATIMIVNRLIYSNLRPA